MVIERLASAIKNDVLGGLAGYHSNLSMSLEQLEDEIISTRLALIKEYQLKGILSKEELLEAVNCIPVDCKNIEKCSKCLDSSRFGTPTAHFEIPQIVSIEYLGSVDKQLPFLYYTSINSMKAMKHRKRGKNKPMVWIDTTPNENGMFDCFVFNAPLLKQVSLIGIFKDPRQLAQYSCCDEVQDNFSHIDIEVHKRLVQQKLYYYRQLRETNKPNTQAYS